MTAGNDTHTQREGVEFLIVERYVSNNHTPIMNLKRHTCVCLRLSLCPLFTRVFCSSYHITASDSARCWQRERNPGPGVTQRLLSYTAEFTSKIRHGGVDMTALGMSQCG